MVIVIMMMVIVIIMIASYTNVSHRHHDIRCGNRGQQQEQEQGYVMLDEHWMFLAVQNSSIGDLVCPLVCPAPLTIRHYKVTLETCDL